MTKLRSSVVSLVVVFELEFPVLALTRIAAIYGNTGIYRLLLFVKPDKFRGAKAFQDGSGRQNDQVISYHENVPFREIPSDRSKQRTIPCPYIWHVFPLRVTIPVRPLKLSECSLFGMKSLKNFPIIIESGKTEVLLSHAVIVITLHRLKHRPTASDVFKSQDCSQVRGNENNV